MSFSELDTTAERIELRWKLFSFGQCEFDLPFKNSRLYYQWIDNSGFLRTNLG